MLRRGKDVEEMGRPTGVLHIEVKDDSVGPEEEATEWEDGTS